MTDAAGNPLDGNKDGKPGGDYLATFRGSVVLSVPSPTGFGKGRDAFVRTLYNEVLGRGLPNLRACSSGRRPLPQR